MEQKSKEDYLRIMYKIYESLEDKSTGIRSVDLSNALNISKPSVSEMIKKLAKNGYAKAKAYSNIFFTGKGLREAIRITHNHRVIEVFLKEILSYDLNKTHENSEIHKEAHRLEHAFSEESVKRLDKFLSNPKRCPDGNLIPHNKS